MKIFIVTYKFPPTYSGYGNQLYSLLNYFSQSAHKNSIEFEIISGNLQSQILGDEFHYHVNNLGRKKTIKFNSMIFNIKLFFHLIKNRKHYDKIYCISGLSIPAIPVVLAGKILRKKTYIKVTQGEFRPLKQKVNFVHTILRNLRIMLVKHADNFIAISKEIKRDLRSHKIPKTKIHIIPNGVDTNKYYPANSQGNLNLKKQLGFKDDRVYLLFVGHVSKRKGIFDLVNALKTMSFPIHNKIEIIICGPDDANNMDYVHSELNQTLKIHYLGNVKRIDEIYRMADIFVFPSYSEGLPNALLEASASGLLCVASKIGGNEDIIINNHNGLTFDVGEPGQLSKQLEYAITNIDNLYSLRKEVVKNTVENFSMHSVIRKYEDVFRQ